VVHAVAHQGHQRVANFFDHGFVGAQIILHM